MPVVAILLIVLVRAADSVFLRPHNRPKRLTRKSQKLQFVEGNNVVRSGTLLTFKVPLYPGGLDGVTPGSSCIANA